MSRLNKTTIPLSKQTAIENKSDATETIVLNENSITEKEKNSEAENKINKTQSSELVINKTATKKNVEEKKPKKQNNAIVIETKNINKTKKKNYFENKKVDESGLGKKVEPTFLADNSVASTNETALAEILHYDLLSYLNATLSDSLNLLPVKSTDEIALPKEKKSFKKFRISFDYYFTNAKHEITPADENLNLYYEKVKQTVSYKNFDQPELSATFFLSKHFGVKAGVTYTEVKEQFQFTVPYTYYKYDYDTTIYYILFPFNPPQQVIEVDSNLLELQAENSYASSLKIKTISIPLQLVYGVDWKKFRLEGVGGVLFDISNKATGTTVNPPDYSVIEIKNKNYFKQGTSYHAKAGVSLYYHVWKNILVQTSFTWQQQLSKQTVKNNLYNKKNKMTGAGAGVSYQF